MRYVDVATRREWMKRLMEYAKEHYNEGWDGFVECYGTDEWLDLMDCADTYEGAFRLCETLVFVWNDRRADAKAEIAAGVGEEHWQL